MMWPPHRVKMVSTPSLLRALATSRPPETTSASRLFLCSVSVAVDMIGGSPSNPVPRRATSRVWGVRRIAVLAVDIPPGAPDVAVEPHRVLADLLAGALGIARFDRFDDVHVILDRAAHPVAFRHGALADGAHMEEQPVGDVLEQPAAAELENALVEGYVGFRIFVDMGLELVLAVARQGAPQAGDLLVRGMFAGKPRRHAFERRPDGDHFEDLLERVALDEDAAPWLDLDEPLLLEPGQRLADRGAGDAELLRHLALVEAQIRPLVIEVHRRDAVLQHLVNVFFEAEIAANRL